MSNNAFIPVAAEHCYLLVQPENYHQNSASKIWYTENTLDRGPNWPHNLLSVSSLLLQVSARKYHTKSSASLLEFNFPFSTNMDISETKGQGCRAIYSMRPSAPYLGFLAPK